MFPAPHPVRWPAPRAGGRRTGAPGNAGEGIRRVRYRNGISETRVEGEEVPLFAGWREKFLPVYNHRDFPRVIHGDARQSVLEKGTSTGGKDESFPEADHGRGYGVVNSAPVGTQGTVFLTYNSSTGRNCVVTKKNTTGSTPVYMFSYLYVPDSGDGDYDEGDYYSYAGPVYAYGKGMCVDWAGGIANQSTWTHGSNCGSFAEYRVTRGW
jgi:hypothetical protein